ncbi:MAG TPA: hypothetical protein VFU05_15520 [Cyclobacteriaceae bacterium]|nr:hypothetical protein [Cyclobacteriaceae bacterium]
MKIHYLPGVGFSVDDKLVKWGETRDIVRKALSMKFKPNDGVIEVPDDKIFYWRDIYDDFRTNFTEDSRLKELEVHGNVKILVAGVTLVFEKDISEFINELKKLGHRPVETDDGNFFFENLKMVIATSASMGGDGDGLSYFYAGDDVSHIIDEINQLRDGI